MRNKKVLLITQAAVIAAIYVVLTMFLTLQAETFRLEFRRHSVYFRFLHLRLCRDSGLDVCWRIF